ncbi:hypothetical protein ACFZC5_09225 [Nocardia gamkensis]
MSEVSNSTRVEADHPLSADDRPQGGLLDEHQRHRQASGELDVLGPYPVR